MNSIVAIDDTSFDSPIDLDSSSTAIEPEFPDESIDQLLARANSQLTEVRSLIVKTSTVAPPLSTATIQATSEMEAGMDREIPAPIDIMNVTDDDVIFVGEESSVINLCSPDKGSRSSRSVLSENNGRQKKANSAAAKSVAQADEGSEPMTNSVMCAVCMESSVGRQPHSTRCGHIFCGDCIKEAIKITKKCPLCNKALNPKSLMPVFI